MTKTYKAALPLVVLLFSALALSACASKPKQEPVVAPAAPAAVQAPAPEPTPAAPPAAEPPPSRPSALVETLPPPKPVIRKHKRKMAKAAPVKAPEPEPAPAPPPMVKEETPAPAPPPAVVTAPIQPVAEKSFLENYWQWIVGVVIAAVAIVGVALMTKKS